MRPVLASILVLSLFGLARPATADPLFPDRPDHWIDAFDAPSGCTTGAAFGDRLLYVADRQTDRIYGVDPKKGTVKRDIPAPGFIPQGLAHDGTWLWVYDAGENKVFRLDPADGTVSLSFDTPSAGITGLAHDGTDLWLADRPGKRLLRVSTVDGTTIASIPSPGTRTTGLAWDGLYLWAADRIEDEVYRVDPATGDVVLVLQAGGEHPWGLAWDGKQLLAGDYQSDQVQQLRPADLPPYDLLEERNEEITFHHEVRAYGPEPLLAATISIALPSDRPGLELLGDLQFEPSPDEIVSDAQGQRVARFTFEDVPPPELRTVVMRIRARTRTIRHNLMPEEIADLDDIPREIREAYLGDGDKYRIDDPLIREIVGEVVGDETNAYRVARALYDHVIGRMEYELAGGWNVAPAVLARGTGSCSEYTFSYIALCRAAGLPARYVGSVVRRYDDASVDDVFHRWTEVYLPPYGWVPVDLNRGDKELPHEQARGFGYLDSGLVVTTESAGFTEDLGWNYNSASHLTTRGPAKVVEEVYAEWEPLGED